MGSVNKVILVGNLGRDAELRFTPGGAAIAKFSIATTEVWNDKSGQRQERTEWHNVDLWGKQAESLKEYLTKGKQVFVEGRLQSRKAPRAGIATPFFPNGIGVQAIGTRSSGARSAITRRSRTSRP